MTAFASRFDPAKLPVALRQGCELVDDCSDVSADTRQHIDADRFEDGQISGPFGPQFVGYGPMPKMTLAQRFGTSVAIAIGIGLLAAAMMVAGL